MKDQKPMEKLIYLILSEEFKREILPDFGLVTITGIKVSSDKSWGDVYISNMPENRNIIDFLNSKIGHFQSKVNKKIQKMKIPKLRFNYDGSGEFAASLENLF
ncbi:ribosome-binding factor A [Candidatus Gracilibacteria bacterium]|nr:ribosome-binding factor A [Candidatus Gracilibacteria bacterium]